MNIDAIYKRCLNQFASGDKLTEFLKKANDTLQDVQDKMSQK